MKPYHQSRQGIFILIGVMGLMIVSLVSDFAQPIPRHFQFLSPRLATKKTLSPTELIQLIENSPPSERPRFSIAFGRLALKWESEDINRTLEMMKDKFDDFELELAIKSFVWEFNREDLLPIPSNFDVANHLRILMDILNHRFIPRLDSAKARDAAYQIISLFRSSKSSSKYLIELLSILPELEPYQSEEPIKNAMQHIRSSIRYPINGFDLAYVNLMVDKLIQLQSARESPLLENIALEMVQSMAEEAYPERAPHQFFKLIDACNALLQRSPPVLRIIAHAVTSSMADHHPMFREQYRIHLFDLFLKTFNTTSSDEIRYDMTVALAKLCMDPSPEKERFEHSLYHFIFHSDDKTWAWRNIRSDRSSWFDPDEKTKLKKKAPTLTKILSNRYVRARFLFILTAFRDAFPDELEKRPIETPLVYAQKSGIQFRLGELTLVPMSDSYRRHIFILYTQEAEGEPFAVELKIPGKDRNRDAIWKTHFDISKQLWDLYPNDPGVVKPIFFLGLRGQFSLYGREFQFTDYPLGIMCFEYQDRKRYIHYRNLSYLDSLIRDTGKSREELLRSMTVDPIVTLIRLHHLGWRGNTEAGSDVHAENLGVLRNGRVVFVGDFGSFINVGSVPLSQRKKELEDLFNYSVRLTGPIEPAVVRAGIGEVDHELLLSILARLTDGETISGMTRAEAIQARAKIVEEAILTILTFEWFGERFESLLNALRAIQQGKTTQVSLTPLEDKILQMVVREETTEPHSLHTFL